MPRAAALAVGAVAGALLLSGPPPFAAWPGLASMLLALAIAATSSASPRRRSSARLLLTATFGAVLIALRVAGGGSTLPPPSLPGDEARWDAVVESISSPRGGTQVAVVRIDEPSLRVSATLPRFPEILPGDRIEIGGRLVAPGDDAFGDYLRRSGVDATIRSRSLIREGRSSAALDVELLRRGAAEALARAIPEPAAGLAAGILLGLRDRVDRALAADFTTAGASHVVAISGWNIAIVAASVAAVAGSVARRRRALITVAAIAAYVAFVGPTPSVLRAAAMAGVVLLARETGRAGRAASALSWAAVVILLVDPSLVRDAGFQLSTLATAGLLAWATPLTAWIAQRTGGHAPGWLTENLGVSLAAQAATLPVVLASFGRLSLVAPLVNLAVVPFIAPAMAAGAIALGGGLAVSVFGAPGVVATTAGLPAWAALTIVITAVRLGAAMPFASVSLGSPFDVLAALVATVLILGIASRSVRTRLRRLGAPRSRVRSAKPVTLSSFRTTRAERLAAIALAVAVAGTAFVVVHRPDGRTRITVLDVGQGDAILIEGSHGGRTLVDGGPDPDRLLVALDEHIAPWDRRIDALILTHPHEDHVAGLAVLLDRYRIGRVLEPGMRGPGPGYAAFAERLATGGTTAGLLTTGDRFALDEIRFDVLWPDPRTVPREPSDTGTGINNVSIVLLGTIDGRRFLLAGDVEEDIDPILIGRGLPHVDVLKVAHHGSRTSSTQALLDALTPSIAVISAGAGNPYGHPAKATVQRLQQRIEHVLRTDANGSVEIDMSADRVTVHTSGARRVARRDVAPASREAAFLCGIPSRGLAAAPSMNATRPAPRPNATPSAARRGSDDALGYHRPDDGPRARRGRGPAAVARSARLARAPFAGRRRGRVVASRSRARDRRPAEQRAGRDGRAPP